jgi:thiol-disulfide isomerase/thioredoxin
MMAKWLLISAWVYAAAFLVFKALIVETSRLAARIVFLQAVASGLPPQIDRISLEVSQALFSDLRLALFQSLLLGLCLILAFAAVYSARAHRRLLAVLAIMACLGAIAAAGWVLWPRYSTSETEASTLGAQSTSPSAAPDGPPVPARFFPPLNQPIEVRTLDDTPISIPLERPRRFLILEFGASWCAPCVQALPGLKALGAELSRIAPTHIYLVSLDATKEAARRFAGEHDEFLTPVYTGGRAWDHEISAAFRVTEIPHTVLVLPDGRNRSIDLRAPSGIEFARRVLADPGTPKEMDSKREPAR